MKTVWKPRLTSAIATLDVKELSIIEKVSLDTKDVIEIISEESGCPRTEVSMIINTLGNVVRDKVSDWNDYTELKICPGLKVTAEYISPEQSHSNLKLNCDQYLRMGVEISRRFKDSIRQLHKEKGNY